MAAATSRRRDYHKEQARRNELARLRGFSSRGQQRRAEERGEVARAKVRASDARVDARERLADASRRGRAAGFASDAEYRAARLRAGKWSRSVARQDRTRAVPLDPQAFARYYKGLVDQKGKRFDNSRRGALRDYFVDVLGMDPLEFEELYGADD